jgi:aspartyl-tRNA(Asn)/glutamyl-tRNA(Gln) amidotransferase subunit A
MSVSVTRASAHRASAPADPLQGVDLREFGRQLRRGEVTAERVTAAYLVRIASIDGHIGAFRAVAGERALEAARGIDALLRAGTDLGPLMGVPIAVKEIFATDGFPYGAGTDLDLAAITPPQGPFMQALRRAGCIVLGTTATTEFAAATINVSKAMPWNPADLAVKRVCGGSSHGSAAAMRAGLCGFAIGSDTGGSVRLPAALCGVFGYKSTAGLWPTEGVFALSPSMDSVGVFTRCADDAALIFAALGSAPMLDAPRPRALRLGRPRQYFFETVDAPVRAAVDAAIAKLAGAGVEIVDVDVPDIDAAIPLFAQLLFGEFVAVMGRARLEAGQPTIDPVAWTRLQTAFGLSAETLLELRRRQKDAVREGLGMMAGIDGLLSPTTVFQPCPLEEVGTAATAGAWNLRAGRNTRPGNYYGQCGTTIPVQPGSELPVGLQIIGRPGDDAALLAVTRTVAAIAGSPPTSIS